MSEPYTELQQLQQLEPEERTLAVKELAEYMVATCELQGLIEAARRVEALYWQSSNERRKPLADQKFTDTAVDILAGATLIALDRHQEKEEAKFAARHWIINGKGAAHNAPFETRTYFAEVGIAAHL